MQHSRFKGEQVTSALMCIWITVGGVMLLALVGTAAAQVEFASPVNYAVGRSPIFLIVGDVDRDGDLDIVVANDFSDSVSVLRNNGNGMFAPAVDYPVGSGPNSVTLGDFNKDGYLDVATANLRSHNISVLLNKRDGTFLAPVHYPVGVPGATGTQSIAVGNVDKDGDLDVVVTNGSFAVSHINTVSVLRNKGNGIFAPAVDYALGVTGPHSVALGDIDKDGDLDMIVTNRDHSTIFVRRNKGNGTFAAAVSFPAVNAPGEMMTADVDQDGDLDVVTANFFGTVAVLRNNGNGTFTTPEPSLVGGHPHAVAVGDIDKDGDLDVAVANYTVAVPGDKPVAVLLNNSNGTFTLAGEFGAVGHNARSIIVTDLDGDGSLDLATANSTSNTVSVLFNQTPPPGIGGSVTGMSPQRVICQNVTAPQRVVIRDGARAWDCSAAGLVTNPGDAIQQTVTGTAD